MGNLHCEKYGAVIASKNTCCPPVTDLEHKEKKKTVQRLNFWSAYLFQVYASESTEIIAYAWLLAN